MVKFVIQVRPFKPASRLILVALSGSLYCALISTLPAQTPALTAAHPVQTELGNSKDLPAVDTQLPPEKLGDVYMARGRYQAAIEAYNRVPKKSATVWNKLGIANQQLLIKDEARKDYEASIKLDHSNADALNNLATIYYSLKQYSNAERFYRKAIKASPRYAVVYKNLGTAYLAEKKMKQGWECYQQALAIDPTIFDHSGLYHVGDPASSQQLGAMNYLMAKSFLLQGHVDKAIDYLRMAIDEGYTNGKKILEDKEFAVLRDSPAFQLLLAEQGNQRAPVKD